MSPGKRKAPEGTGADATTRPNQPPESITRDTDTVDGLLACVRRYEFAARAIADDESLSIKARCKALLELSQRGRHEELPAFIEAGIWRGCRAFFEGDERVPRDVIAANHRLIRRGHDRCPECRRPLPSVADLDRWRELGHETHHRRTA